MLEKGSKILLLPIVGKKGCTRALTVLSWELRFCRAQEQSRSLPQQRVTAFVVSLALLISFRMLKFLMALAFLCRKGTELITTSLPCHQETIAYKFEEPCGTDLCLFPMFDFL